MMSQLLGTTVTSRPYKAQIFLYSAYNLMGPKVKVSGTFFFHAIDVCLPHIGSGSSSVTIYLLS